MKTPAKRKYSAAEKRSNIARLAKALLTRRFKTGFDMKQYSTRSEPDYPVLPSQVKNECGTSCCAAGHAVFVFKDNDPNESWGQYITRILSKSFSPGWKFLFHRNWPDSKPQFAARAYLYLSRKGRVPKDWTYESEYPVPKPKDFDAFILPDPAAPAPAKKVARKLGLRITR